MKIGHVVTFLSIIGTIMMIVAYNHHDNIVSAVWKVKSHDEYLLYDSVKYCIDSCTIALQLKYMYRTGDKMDCVDVITVQSYDLDTDYPINSIIDGYVSTIDCKFYKNSSSEAIMIVSYITSVLCYSLALCFLIIAYIHKCDIENCIKCQQFGQCNSHLNSINSTPHIDYSEYSVYM